MKFKKYFHQYNPKSKKCEEYIVGLTTKGKYIDLYYCDPADGRWVAWVTPLAFNTQELKDIKASQPTGWVLKEISEADVFLLVL
jgi:hypothetical protein